jgi:hypothetical protein
MTSIMLPNSAQSPSPQLTQVELLPPLPLSPVSEQPCASLITAATFTATVTPER